MSKPSASERKIILGCQKGKVRAQEKLYKHYYGYALSVSLRYCYSKEEAVEVMNDSFIKVFEKIDQYNADLSFKAWFRRIIINTAIDYQRKYKKHHFNQDIDEVDVETPEVGIIERLTFEDIQKLLNALPQQLRTIFNLYEIEGYSHQEIGQMLNIPDGTSRTYLTRAKKKLRVLCQKFFNNEYEGAVR